MDTKQLDAFNAYNQAVSEVKSSAGFDQADKSEAGSAFADMVSTGLKQTAQSVANLETMNARAVAGLADPVDVVTAASNAEHMVNTVVSVRDKVIQSYNEILKMPI